ncbi:MAG: TonB-dependent receptor, partial [Acidobacteriia bacterium]|nr:TonB-dependent receptor [Terriglobia bacterium]MBV8906852.1 TonB-dependent receptor [Terriglobia bacterium]
MLLFRCLAFALAVPLAFAQMNTAEISGTIADLSGSALPGARVVARQIGTGQQFVSVSNGAGEFLLPQLPIGVYSLSVSAISFKETTMPRIEVHAGDRVRQDFVLEVGDKTDVVTIVADPTDAQLESAEIRDVVGSKQVADLPVKDRQFLDLALLSPGVVRPPGGTRGDAMQQAGNLINILGQRSGHNLYLVDGVTVTDEHFNNMVIAPSIDAIEEINIEKTSYAPEFGGKSGAVINVLSKSGSNELHGSLFEFVRNDVFDARNFFDSPTAPIPPFRENQFGGSFGGPVRKNRTFYFLSFEGQRVRKSLTQTFSVPDAAMRTGDFSGLPAIYNPDTVASVARQPFANNQIPAGLLDPAAVAMLAHIPLPNRPGLAQNLLATGDQRIDQNQPSARIDNQFSSNDTLYLRASIFDAQEFDPFGSGVLQESLLPGFGRNLSTHSVNGVAGWTHVVSPNIVNEARAGFLTVTGGQTSPNAGNPFAAQAGIAGVTTNQADIGYPQISLGGQFTTMGDPALFTYRNNHDYEFYDNLSWHKDRHTIKIGAYFMHFNLETVNPNGARGVFSFAPHWTSSAPGLADGSAFADLLLGYPTTAQVGLGRAALDGNTKWTHLYLQDTWQLASNLKIDFGLRYEYNQNMTDAANQMAAIDTTGLGSSAVPGGRFVIASSGSGQISPAAAALLPFIPILYVTSSAAGWNNSLLTERPARLAPRLGIAWTLPGENKTVVRAGFGIYPNQAAYSIVTNLAQNLPFFVTKTVNSSTTAFAPSFTTEIALTAD